MATSTYRNKNLVRPVKRGKAKRQRVAAQKKRLVGLGMPAATVATMDMGEIRTLLRRPAKVPKAAKRTAIIAAARQAEAAAVAGRKAAAAAAAAAAKP
jgi:hypothetical protein